LKGKNNLGKKIMVNCFGSFMWQRQPYLTTKAGTAKTSKQ